MTTRGNNYKLPNVNCKLIFWKVIMKIFIDYHIHSIYSRNRHGKSTVEEIVEKAVKLGLKEIAISDHGPRHFLFGTKKGDLCKIRNEINKLKEKYPDIKVLLGVEANIISLEGDTEINEVVKECDIILLGFHYGALFKTFKDFWILLVMNFLSNIFGIGKNKMIDINTKAVEKALLKHDVDILTHPGDKIPVDIDRVAKVAEKTNTMLEINDSHRHLNVNEIKIASKYDVKFVIGSDAHHEERVGNYNDALKRAEEAGLDLSRIVNLVES